MKTKPERLQKFLANAGVASRRQCETLIREGRVSINDKIVTELGTKVLPGVQRVKVDNQLVRVSHKRYLVMYKPRGVICSLEGEPDLPLISDYLPRHMRGVLKPVGRLDVGTSGLIFLTNDGEFANRVMHPRFNVMKEYRVKVNDPMTDDQLTQLRGTIRLEDGPVKADRVTVIERTPEKTVINLAIHEGRHHVVRRMIEALGLRVQRLTRTRIGCVEAGAMKSGDLRELSMTEVAYFLQEQKPGPKTRAPEQGRRAPRPGKRAR